MTVEGLRSGSNGEDRFPIGMRVLAVDDDPTCLLILEALLKKCQYQVTTTNQAIMALKMLRENRNKYDLVISDVNMPDMDGFKLLELVGLEMDLPVIMLSAHSDTKLVMKGVTHGACDYLLKPVRIEELRNIWQHVVKRRKSEPEDQNKAANQDDQPGLGEAESASAGSGDQNGKITNKKRKDQSEEEEEESEDDERKNEDPSTQKKPRVVWSVELHRNFVAAVNQLGFDKAFPKKILDLMNVEGLTRENVASHLQKYRLYLKRIVAAQQANMVPLPGMRDISYSRVGSFDGSGDFRTFNGPRRFSSTFSSSYQAGGMLDRLNSSCAFRQRAISPSAITSQAASNTIHALGKVQPTGVPASQNQRVNLVNQRSQNRSGTCVTELISNVNYSVLFGVAGSSPDSRVMSSSVPAASSSSFLLRANTHAVQSSVAFGNQSCLGLVSLQQEPFDIRLHGSSNFLDHSRSDENWTGTGIPKSPANSVRMSEATGLEDMAASSFQDNMSWSGSRVGNGAVNISSSLGHSANPEDGRRNMQFQAGLSSNLVDGMKQWQDRRQNYCQNVNNSFSSASMPSKGYMTGQNNAFKNILANASLLGHLNGDSPLVVQQSRGEKSVFDPKLSSNFSYSLEQQKHQNGFIKNNYTSLDDIMSTIVKPGQINETAIIDGEFGFDAYSFGSCM